jgi:hypothetical protein
LNSAISNGTKSCSIDIVIGGYGTNLLAPAMPAVIQKKKMLIGLGRGRVAGSL